MIDLMALILDPALFTAPYDAALSQGLASASVETLWLTRSLRRGEEAALPSQAMQPIFYPRTDGLNRREGSRRKLLKGLEHVVGLAQAVRLAQTLKPDVVHLQWAVIPLLDRIAMHRLRNHAPVVFTVHDLTPFNGKDVHASQRRGFAGVLKAADRLIVHTAGACDRLASGGILPERIEVVPHGLLVPKLTSVASAGHGSEGARRWRLVQIGRIQHYKGVDLLIEALGRLAPIDRDRIQVVVAGEPQVDIGPLRARAEALGLGAALDLRFGFLSEQEMGDLLASADGFVFPYRTVEASGVLHLIAGLNRWIVASDVGAFPDLIGRDGAAGALVDATDADRLAAALLGSIGRVPSRMIGADVPSWDEIGQRTRDVYTRAHAGWIRR